MPTTPSSPEIYYETHGQAGPWIVFLNGMSQTTANWHSQTQKFSENFRVLVLDSRGQGKSQRGDVAFSLEAHASDLRRVFDAAGVDAPILCGFSHGARVALHFAAQFPEISRALVLTSAGARSDGLRRAMLKSWRSLLDKFGVEAMAWCSITHILGTDYLAANEKILDAIVRATVQRNSREGLLAMLDALMSYAPALQDAPFVRCPTLLISSPDDLLVSAPLAAELAAAIPHCEHRVVTGCGHTIPIEKPEQWRSLVEEFATRISQEFT